MKTLVRTEEPYETKFAHVKVKSEPKKEPVAQKVVVEVVPEKIAPVKPENEVP